MTSRIAVLALALGLPVSAQAQSWADFGSAFPLFPCQDGWMACLVDGRAVNPDMDTSAGTPAPANMRVDWFDLRPTATFSPFVRLSQYTGELPGGVAAADVDDGGGAPEVVPAPEPPPPPPEPSAEEIAAKQEAKRAREEASRMEAERRQAEEAAKRAAAEQEEQRKAAAEAERRKKELEAQAKAAADAAEADRLRKQAEEEARKAKEAEEARKKAEAEAKKAEEERIAKQKAEEEARKKAEEEAQRLAALQAEEEAKRKAAEEEARKKAEEERKKQEELAKQQAEQGGGGNDGAADAGGGAADAASATCEIGELVKFEPQAMLGKMSLAQTKACESTLASASKMTDKEKISRLLMSNAYAKGDKAQWEQLIKRHLDEIDQSDPDLCYKYALHMSQQGVGRATGVIRWANVALENRTVWTGDTYTSRVNSLYKLRAAAANQLWQKAEADHAAAPSEDTKKKVDDYRNQTKVLAREWYEYAKQAGKDATLAMQLCMSAAGTASYCEGS